MAQLKMTGAKTGFWSSNGMNNYKDFTFKNDAAGANNQQQQENANKKPRWYNFNGLYEIYPRRLSRYIKKSNSQSHVLRFVTTVVK